MHILQRAYQMVDPKEIRKPNGPDCKQDISKS
jgi:hypothetical protein